MARQPDPRDFVGRAGTRLTLLGNPLRFVGYDIAWLGVRPDGAAPAGTPDDYELHDALATIQALGATVLRTRPAPETLDQLDLVLKTARDMGLRVIVPLAGGAGDCATLPAALAVSASADTLCATLHRRGLSDARAFFTDAGTRADFLAQVRQVLNHVNTLTGTAYRDDPTIMAWENCLGCGTGADRAAVGAWAEEVGQAIKSIDPRHLYENGSLAGRIGAAPSPAQAFAPPSADIVGDDLVTGHDPAAARAALADVAGLIEATGKVYVLDSVGWSPALWKTTDDMQAWMAAMLKQRTLSGVVIGRLQAHDSKGGYLPPAAPIPAQGVASLYFPGIATADMDADTMKARGRALRRFAYGMTDIFLPPAYLLPPKPEMISAVHGRVAWRGSAGAAAYSIERSADPSAPGSWQVVCNACATDQPNGWQDPAPTEPSWYRVMPININGHKSVPSDPVQNRP